jgi:hypothetical protein
MPRHRTAFYIFRHLYHRSVRYHASWRTDQKPGSAAAIAIVESRDEPGGWTFYRSGSSLSLTKYCLFDIGIISWAKRQTRGFSSGYPQESNAKTKLSTRLPERSGAARQGRMVKLQTIAQQDILTPARSGPLSHRRNNSCFRLRKKGRASRTLANGGEIG